MRSWTFAPSGNIDEPFDVAVIMTSLLRPTLLQAVRSVFAQAFDGRIQILIGVDRAESGREVLDRVRAECPAHMAVTVCDPGYSTRPAYGAHNRSVSRSGGPLPAALSALAHSRFLAYLDDDNWWAPDHIASLRQAIDGVGWAWTMRWMVRATDDAVLTVDRWLAAGPHSGVFGRFTGGLVDTNCMMLDRARCGDVIWRWARAPHRDGAGHDQLVFQTLLRKEPGAGTGKPTVYYRIPAEREPAVRLMMQRPVDEPYQPVPTSLAELRRALVRLPAAATDAGRAAPPPPDDLGRVLQRMLNRRRPRDIAVLGDRSGDLTIAIAAAARAAGLQASVLAVDPWLPQPGDDPARGQYAMQRSGLAHARFAERLRATGVDNMVWPLGGCPRDVAAVLLDRGVSVDLLALSATVATPTALVRAWWPVLQPQGLIVADLGDGQAVGRDVANRLVNTYGARVRRIDAGACHLLAIHRSPAPATVEDRP